MDPACTLSLRSRRAVSHCVIADRYILHICLHQVLDDSLAESQAEWGAANAEYNANIQRLQQHTEALQQKQDSLVALNKCATWSIHLNQLQQCAELSVGARHQPQSSRRNSSIWLAERHAVTMQTLATRRTLQKMQ